MNRLFDFLRVRLSAQPDATDRNLLDNFLATRDECAFAELVRRHGPLVWGICRRRFTDHDAEDAFQATFLVLLRRAAQLGADTPLGPWLYRVAAMTTRNMARGIRRRAAVSGPMAYDVPAPGAGPPVERLDLDAALLGLPERDRAAIVLCHLQGLSRREAAARLGCPEGTLSARLSRALTRLRTRLGSGALAVLTSAGATVMPPELSAATTKVGAVYLTSTLTAAGMSPTVAEVAEGVLRMFWMKKLMAGLALMVLVAGGLVAGLAAPPGNVANATDPSRTDPRAGEPKEPPEDPGWFEDVTDKVGLKFIHDPGDVDKYLTYQIVGSGCAIADLDGDGRPDLILLTGGGPTSKSTNKLYCQKADGTFEDVSAGSGLDFSGWNVGIAIGDVNNDGRPDIIITQVDGVKLLLNQGGMKFVDVTVEAGISNPHWGASAAFLDYDRDGWLDLLIVNYVDYDPSRQCKAPGGERDYCGPEQFRGTSSKLFRNCGGPLASNPDAKKPRVLFEDVTMKSRIGTRTGAGLGVAVADFDGDGWPDIFIANDGNPNHLWINKRDGTFAEEAMLRGVALTAIGKTSAGSGVAIGDVDNDGLLDLHVPHTLWKQGPRGQFRDFSAWSGLNATGWRGTGFGTLMADFDNDGWIDLAVVNGRTSREATPAKKPGLAPHWVHYGERNQVFANTGQGKFKDVSINNPALCGYFTVARGLACGDVDGDGGLDLLVNAVGEKARLFRNVADNRGHWVSVRAVDPRLNRDAIGAVVAVRAGGVRRVRQIVSSESFQSAGPPVAHFGLGKSSEVEGYEVTWPDGVHERFPGGPVDRHIELRKGAGTRP
jgi:enediyne biosynthesis protein E4